MNAAYSRTLKERPLLIPDVRKIEGKRTLLIPYNRKQIEVCLFKNLKRSKQTLLIPEIGKIDAEKKRTGSK
jgi:hypothetical protein